MGSDRPHRSDRSTVEAEKQQSEDVPAEPEGTGGAGAADDAGAADTASATDGTSATDETSATGDPDETDVAAAASTAGPAGKAHDGAAMPSRTSPPATDERESGDLARSVRDLAERDRSLSLWRSVVAGAAVGAVAVGLAGLWVSGICYGLGALLAGYGHNGTSQRNAVAGGAAVGVALTTELLVEAWRVGVFENILSNVSSDGPVEVGTVLLAIGALYAVVLFVTCSFGGVVGLFGGALAGVGDDEGGPGTSSQTEVGGDFDRRK